MRAWGGAWSARTAAMIAGAGRGVVRGGSAPVTARICIHVHLVLDNIGEAAASMTGVIIFTANLKKISKINKLSNIAGISRDKTMTYEYIDVHPK